MNRIAYGVEKIYERRGDEFSLLLARESGLRCLILHGKWKLAQRVFREETERIPRLLNFGSLHQALLLKSGAQLAWETGDVPTWKQLISEALLLMNRSGLSHQYRLTQHQYGISLIDVMKSLDL